MQVACLTADRLKRESVEFSELSFRTNLLEATPKSELQKSHFGMQRKELAFLFLFYFCVFVVF